MLRQVFVKLAGPHSSDDGVDSSDELILARHNDSGLALLELDRLRPIADRQPDCPEHVLPPASGLAYAVLRPAQMLADGCRTLT